MTPPNRLQSLLPTLIALLALAVAVAGFLLIRDLRGDMRDIAGKLDSRETERTPAAHPLPNLRAVPSRPQSGTSSPRMPGLPLSEEMAQTSPEEVKRRTDEWVAATRAEFATEPVNPVWAAETETALVDASVHEDLADTVEKMQSFDAECRSRRCLVETRFADRGSALDWLGIYLLNAEPLHLTTHQLVMNPDGTVTIVLIGGK